MRLRSELMVPVVTLIIFGVVVGFLLIGGEYLGMDSDDTNTIITLIPGIIVIFVAFYAVSMSSGYILGAAVAAMGLSVAFLLHLMDATSLIVDEPTLLVSDLQILVVVAFLILGVGYVMRELWGR